MHGRPADVPGSWVNGAPLCGNTPCLEDIERIAKQSELECDACQAERQKRKLVATSPEDARLREGNFLEAVPIYVNQDIRCHVEKQRAVQWAKER
eukprot:8769073-Pyramimonas_sp.AAC.1